VERPNRRHSMRVAAKRSAKGKRRPVGRSASGSDEGAESGALARHVRKQVP